MIKVFSYVKLSSLRRALLMDAGGSVAARPVYALPSRANEDLLLDMLRGSGNYFAERPEVWSWQDIYNKIAPKRARRRCVDPPDHYLILQYVRDTVASEMASSGVTVPPGMLRRGFILSLGEAVNEMLLEDVVPEMVAGHELLRRLYSGYLAYLEAHGLADNSQLPSLALRALGGSLPREMEGVALRWVGFMSFTGAQLRLIRELSSLGVGMEFFVPDSGGANFRDAAAQLGAAAESVETGGCAARPYVCPDMYSMCDFAADFIAGEGDSDCGILAAPGTSRAVCSALTRRGVPWQSRSEVTVDDTALIGLAREAWETSKLGWPPARTANLLRGLAVGVEIDSARFAAEMPEGGEMWREFLSGDDAALAAFSRLETFCAAVGSAGGSTAEDLLIALYGLSGDGGWETRLAFEAGDDLELDPAIREIASARLEIAAKLSMIEEAAPALGEASSVRFAGDDAMEFLIGWAGEAATALPPRQRGVVSVYESPPPVLAAHDVWVMTGVDAARYPGSAADHALLSEEIREAVNSSPDDCAHLPTMREKRGQKEAMFRRLLAIGERLTLTIRAASDASGNPAGESPFARRENFTGPRWAMDVEAEALPAERPRPRAFRKFPLRVISTAGGSRAGAPKGRVSLSQLDALLDCPFAYWCDRRARLASPPDTGEIIDRLTLGVVAHGIWARAAAAAESGTPHAAALFAVWDEAIQAMSSDYPLVRDSRSASALAGLRIAMSSVADLIDAMWRSAEAGGMERLWTKVEFALPDVETENVIFRGRADRIDFWRWPGGEGAVVMDYKLGKSAGYAGSNQLAAYGAALRGAGVPVAGFCYLCHGDAAKVGAWSPETRDVFAGKTRGKSCGERIDEAELLFAEADALIAAGRYEANYDSKSCARCEYVAICRRGEQRGDYESGGEDDE